MENNIPSFDEIYYGYYIKVNRYIKKKINNPEDANDLTQDVFEYCYRKLDSFDPNKSSISTWLFLITNSRLKNYYRDTKSNDCIDDYENILPDTNDDMEKAVYLEELKKMLLGAIDELPQKQQDVVIRFYFWEQSHAEIAKELGLSEGNSRVILSRALTTMRDLLKDKV